MGRSSRRYKLSRPYKAIRMPTRGEARGEVAATSGSGGNGGGSTIEGGVKLSDLIPKFDGTSDVSQWLQQLDVARVAAKIADVALVMPAFLRGSAFTVYANLTDEERQGLQSHLGGTHNCVRNGRTCRLPGAGDQEVAGGRAGRRFRGRTETAGVLGIIAREEREVGLYERPTGQDGHAG